MNWFERHLNWTLFLGLIYIPTNAGFTIGLIVSIIMIVEGLFRYGFSRELLDFLSTDVQQLGKTVVIVIGISVLLLIIVFTVRLGFWFLDRKGHSRGYVAWLVATPFIGIALMFSTIFLGPAGIIIGLAVAFLGPIVGLIILLLLKNQGMDFVGDVGVVLANRREPDQWMGSVPLDVPDDRQLKELDYTPDKNIMDMVGTRNTGNVGATGDVADIGAPVQEKVEKKVVESVVSQEIIKPPILLDDTGAAIHCFYHPGADAVNLCSRCGQYVCVECNYITGTHPICHNCWNTRGKNPIAPSSVKKPVATAAGKPEKEEAAKPEKSAKSEAEKDEWHTEFVALCEQASPIINVVIRKSADGMTASPLDLMEGLKLRPMLERSKKLSKPKDKELREAKDEFEQILSGCIKIADAAANFVGGGGQALQNGPDFKRIVDGIDTANELMEKLSQRLATFAKPQE
jgi:hypothetical protein